MPAACHPAEGVRLSGRGCQSSRGVAAGLSHLHAQVRLCWEPHQSLRGRTLGSDRFSQASSQDPCDLVGGAEWWPPRLIHPEPAMCLFGKRVFADVIKVRPSGLSDGPWSQ